MEAAAYAAPIPSTAGVIYGEQRELESLHALAEIYPNDAQLVDARVLG